MCSICKPDERCSVFRRRLFDSARRARGATAPQLHRHRADLEVVFACPALKAFDGRGNYTLGVTEQIIFPEIDIDKVNKITGLDITFVTTAGTNEEAYELLKELGMPFKNAKKENN